MKILKKINETILFHKVKNLDSKYFATLCDNWEEKNNLDNAYCFPYNAENSNFEPQASERVRTLERRGIPPPIYPICRNSPILPKKL